jgi:hypothetical protein
MYLDNVDLPEPGIPSTITNFVFVAGKLAIVSHPYKLNDYLKEKPIIPLYRQIA